MEVIAIEKLGKAFLLYSNNNKKARAIHVLKIVERPRKIPLNFVK